MIEFITTKGAVCKETVMSRITSEAVGVVWHLFLIRNKDHNYTIKVYYSLNMCFRQRTLYR